MEDTEVITPEVMDEATEKALVGQRQELEKLSGATLFYSALEAFFKEAEAKAQVALRGSKTFALSASRLTEKPLVTEDEYRSCVALSVEAAAHEKQATEPFKIATEFLFKSHRAMTGIRGIAAKPWTTAKDKLTAHAERWVIEQRKLAKKAEAQMNASRDKEKQNLQEQAQEKLAMGFVKEARDLMLQAQIAATPVSVGPVQPVVPGARVTPKLVATVTDIMAVAKAIVEGRFPLMHSVQVTKGGPFEEQPLLILDEKVLKALVDRQGEGLAKSLPGIVIEEATKISATGRG